ncbi:MAG: hypothetical protein U9N10_02195 [Bacillota bacterium]|nr:hypothetical protein [Bacillota bacterium]
MDELFKNYDGNSNTEKYIDIHRKYIERLSKDILDTVINILKAEIE